MLTVRFRTVLAVVVLATLVNLARSACPSRAFVNLASPNSRSTIVAASPVTSSPTTQRIACLTFPAASCTSREMVVATSTRQVLYLPFVSANLLDTVTGSRALTYARYVGQFPFGPASALEVADIDGNGWNDVLVATASGVRAFLSRGSLPDMQPFLRVTSTVFPLYALLPNSILGFVATLVDVNGDGAKDLYTISPARLTAFIFINVNGTFSNVSPITSSAPASCEPSAVWGRLNNDTLDDYCCLTANGGRCVINTGGGSFSGMTVVPGVSSGAGRFLFSDLTRDGLSDLVYWRTVPAQIELLPNINGAFGSAIVLALTSAAAPISQLLSVGDVNNDGWPELFYSDTIALHMVRALGAGTFAATAVVDATAGSALDLTVFDLDASGTADLVLVFDGGLLRVLLNVDGSGLLWQTATLKGNYTFNVGLESVSGIDCFDVSGDGLADVVIASRAGRILAFVNRGNLTLDASVVLHDGGDTVFTIYVPPISRFFSLLSPNDTMRSVALSSPDLHSCTVSQVDPSAFFPSFDVNGSLAIVSESVDAIEARDFDGDSNVDLLVVSANALRWRQALGGGAFAPSIVLVSFPGHTGRLTSGQIDNSFGPDAVVTAGNQVYLVRRNATGWAPVTTNISMPLPQQPELIDMDDDGLVDLVLPLRGTNTLVWARGDGLGAFALAAVTVIASSSAAGQATSVQRGEFIASSYPDIVFRHASANALYIAGGLDASGLTWAPLGTIDTAAVTLIALPESPSGGTLTTIVSFVSGMWRVFLRANTTATFALGSLPNAHVSTPEVSMFADMDGDSYIDLVVSGLDEVAVYRNPLGTFSSLRGLLARTPTVSDNYFVTVADVNVDGALDLVQIGRATLTLSNLVNQGAGVTSELVFAESVPTVLTELAGVLADIRAFDENRDGLSEVVVTSTTGAVWMLVNGDRRGGWVPKRMATLTGITQSPGRTMTFADLDNSTYPDVVLAFQSQLAVVWLQSSWGQPGGGANWTVHRLNSTGAAVGTGSFVQVGDLDSDGLVDIVVSVGSNSVGGNGLAWYRALDGRGAFAPRAPIFLGFNFVSRSVSSFALMDVNGDQRLDFLINGAVTNTIVAPILESYAAINLGRDAVTGALAVSTPNDWADMFQMSIDTNGLYGFPGVYLGDANHDGMTDALVMCWSGAPSCSNAGSPLVYLANSFWLPRPIPPRVIPVDVSRCGFTMSCVSAAIAAASQCNGDIVLLPPGTYGMCNSLALLGISKSLALQGDQAVIDCSNSNGNAAMTGIGFHVLSSASVTVTGITFRRFRSSSDSFGGAVFRVSETATLRLERVRIEDCTAPASLLTSVRTPLLGFGAGVLVLNAASLVVVDSVFARNSAAQSGASIAAVGDGFSVSLSNCSFTGDRSAYSGGSVFVEIAQPGFTSSVTLSDCSFYDVAALTDFATNPTGTANGGALAVLGYAGSLAVTATRCSFDRAVASSSGGAIDIFAARTTAVQLTLVNSTVNSTAASEDGGAIRFGGQDSASGTLTLSGVTIAGATASGSGGAVAVSSTTTLLGTPTVTVLVTAGSVISRTSAGLDGGALALVTRLASDVSATAAVSVALVASVTGESLIAGARAGRMGGAILSAGRVRLLLDGASVDDSAAEFGGLIASYGLAAALDAVPARVSSLAALPPASGLVVGCAGAGSANVSSCRLSSVRASYGGVAFVCESAVSFVDAQRSFEANGASVAGGLAASCLYAGPLTRCAGAGAPCCGATAATLLGFPWLEVSAALGDTLGESLVPIVGGYGPIVASPPAQAAWISAADQPPESIATGLALGRGRLRYTDLFGQAIVDSRTAVALEITRTSGGAATSADASIVAGSQAVFLSRGVGDFSDLALAVASASSIGESRDLAFALVGSGVTTASPVEYAALRVVSTLTITECAPGSGTISAELLQCAICAVGSFTNSSGLGACVRCEGTSFNQLPGATRCLTCPPGTGLAFSSITANATASSATLNCTCTSGFWAADGGASDAGCAACPVGGVCPGGATLPYAAPGFYPTDSSGVFLECPNAGACAGGSPFACARGYEDRLCGKCAESYYTLGTRCVKCTDQTGPVIALGLVCAFALACVLVWFNTRSDVNLRFAAIVIGLNSLQVSAMYGRLNLAWPEFARQWFNVISFLNLNFDLASPECAARAVDVWLLKYVLTIILPVLFLVPFAAAFGCGLAYVHFCAARLGRRTSLTWRTLADAVWRSYVQLFSLLYMALCGMTLSFFRCRRERDGKFTLESSPSKRCYDASWWRLFPLGLTFAIVYAFVLPGLVLALLIVSRRRAAASESLWRFELRFAFLVARFADRAYWFEITVMARKLGVSLAMTIFGSEVNKAYGALAVLVFALCHKFSFRPYRARYHNTMGLVCLASCSAVLWGGINPDTVTRTTLVAIGLIVNTVAIVAGNVFDVVVLARTRRSALAQAKQHGAASEADFDDTAHSVEMRSVQLSVRDDDVTVLPVFASPIDNHTDFNSLSPPTSLLQPPPPLPPPPLLPPPAMVAHNSVHLAELGTSSSSS